MPGVANPVRLSRTPVTYRHGPPALGAHTEAVLRDWLGAKRSRAERALGPAARPERWTQARLEAPLRAKGRQSSSVWKDGAMSSSFTQA